MTRSGVALDQTVDRRAYRIEFSRTQTEGLHNYRTGSFDEDPAARVRSLASARDETKAVRTLIDRWETETVNYSSLDDMIANKYFAALLAVGDRALPGIIAYLRDRPSWVILVLERITGEQPYNEDDEGDLVALTQRWLAWGSVRKLT